MATPPSGYRRARNLVCCISIESDAGAENPGTAVGLAEDRNVYGLHTGRQLDINRRNALSARARAHL
jgi:hypothetical protein